MPADPQADTTHFTWAEAKEMSDNGHEMSNHSWSHPYLTMISEEELIEQIRKNDEAILENIGKPSTTFCFPYNAFNEATIAMAMEGRIGARLKEFWFGGQNSPDEYLHKQIEDHFHMTPEQFAEHANRDMRGVEAIEFLKHITGRMPFGAY